MGNERLSLEIVTQATGQDSVDRLTTAMQRFESASKSAASGTKTGFEILTSSAAGYTVAATKLRTAELSLGSAFSATVGVMARHSAALASSGSAADSVLNSYRALRVALSPTPFTVATVALGLLTEETIRLTNARAKLISQQSLVAATSGISTVNVERLGSAASIGGRDQASVRNLFGALSARSGSERSSVNSGLGILGISQVGAVDPALLEKIARGFASIEDPAKRAAAAVDIFGKENAGLALDQLDTRFANASQAVRDYGLVLDGVSRNQIYQFGREISSVKDALTDFSGVKGWWESVKQGAEVTAAALDDMSRRGVASIDQLLRRVPGLQALAGFAHDTESLTPVQLGAPDRWNSVSNGLTADDLFAQAQAAHARASQTLEGRRAARDSARSQADDLYGQLQGDAKKRRDDPNDPSLLSGDQRLSIASAERTASALAEALQRTVKGMEDAIDAVKKSEADAKRAVEVLAEQRKRAQGVADAETERSIQDPTARALYSTKARLATFDDAQSRAIVSRAGFAEVRSIAGQTAGKYFSDSSEADEKERREDRDVTERIFLQGLQRRIKTDEEAAESDKKIISFQNTLARENGAERVKSLSGAGSFANRIVESSSSLSDQQKIGVLYRQDLATVKAIYEAQKDAASEIINSKDSPYAREEAFNRARIENEEALQKLKEDNMLRLMALQERQATEFASFVISGFNAITQRTGRGQAVKSIVENFVRGQADTVVSNSAKQVFNSDTFQRLQKGIGINSSLTKGTIFDGGSKNIPLDLNTRALQELTARLNVMTGATSPSGAGGSSGSGLGGIFGGGSSSSNPFVFNATGDGDAIPASDWAQFTGGGPASSGPMARMQSMDALSASLGGPSDSSSHASSALRTNVAMGVTAGMGVYTAAQNFKRGGASGVIGGVGALAGTAGAMLALAGVTGPAAPIVAGIGAALSIVGSLLGTGPQKRALDISNTLQASQFHAPTALNVVQSSGGTFADFDAKGNLRTSSLSPYPQVSEGFTWEQTHGLLGGPPTFYNVPGGQTGQYGAPVSSAPVVHYHNYNIQTMDRQSFYDFAQKNHMALADASARNLQETHGRLSSEVARVARP